MAVMSHPKCHVEHLVTPLMPYFIASHYIADELDKSSPMYVGLDISPQGSNILLNRNFESLADFSVLHVQVNYINYFIAEIIPWLEKHKRKIVLITSQWHLPAITDEALCARVLASESIILWASQNPIAVASSRYMGIPYGFFHGTLHQYLSFVREKVFGVAKSKKGLVNLPARAHKHLLSTHTRNKYPIFGKDSIPITCYSRYLAKIANAQFAISTAGDRPDCYRHYECIGLQTLPVSDIPVRYAQIFGANMLFSHPEQMLANLLCHGENLHYCPPDRNMLTVAYWKKMILDKAHRLFSDENPRRPSLLLLL